MQQQITPERLTSDLIIPRFIQGIMLAIIIALVLICLSFGEQLQSPLAETQRIFIRSVLYLLAIVAFPMTNLIRHIQLRLNETMPFTGTTARLIAKIRYRWTTIVSLFLIGVIDIFGFALFMLGDGYNTLYIFSGLSALGMILYRPKLSEYIRIIDKLESNEEHRA
jgi:hypothetical protein